MMVRVVYRYEVHEKNGRKGDQKMFSSVLTHQQHIYIYDPPVRRWRFVHVWKEVRTQATVLVDTVMNGCTSF